MSQSRPAGERTQSPSAKLLYWHLQTSGRVEKSSPGARAQPQNWPEPYQVYLVGLPESAEVAELLEHALEVDNDDGS